MNTFEHLLEQSDYVRYQRALGKKEGKAEGKAEGELEMSRRLLITVTGARFPALKALAQQQVLRVARLDLLERAVMQISLAQDEAAVSTILNALVVTEPTV